MKILIVADEECTALWDYYVPGRLKPYNLILSAGDLKGDYLSFLVTMARCPVMYIHGNHDERFKVTPPEGCDCIDDKLVVYKGVRILGLGGSFSYGRGDYLYTERQMHKRVAKLKRAIKMVGGVDILITHAPAQGLGDMDDPFHRGFEAFLKLMDTYHPKYLFHGHVHLRYGMEIQRYQEYKGTQIINCCGKYEVDYDYPSEYRPLTKLQRLYAKCFVKNLEIFDY